VKKVFSAKTKKVEFEYEFLDGEKATLVARSLTSKEQEATTKAMTKDPAAVVANFKDVIGKQLDSNEKKVVANVIKEQYEHGDIVTFSNALGSMLQEEKAKK